MTATLRASQESPREAQADAVVIGVAQGPDGPLLAPGAEDVDAALGGTLAETLSALGATGKAEEITRIASAGRLTAPLIVAAGIGGADGQPFDGEALRRAAGAGVRSLVAGQTHRIALALPARDAAETEAVALGALLGGYVFGRYRKGGQQADTELTLLGEHHDDDAAVTRANVLGAAMTLVRDLVNTSPSHL